MQTIAIALPKGRLLSDCMQLLSRAEFILPDEREIERRVVEHGGVTWIVMRPHDVPVCVERGAADLGVVGSDVLAERNCDVSELVDLKVGRCRFVVAVPEDAVGQWPDMPGRGLGRLRVATKFPAVATRYFRQRGLEAEIIELRGSTELAPRIGLADVVVDLMQTGRTLRQNGLVVTEIIGESTGRLIANPVSLRLRGHELGCLVDRIRRAVLEEATA